MGALVAVLLVVLSVAAWQVVANDSTDGDPSTASDEESVAEIEESSSPEMSPPPSAEPTETNSPSAPTQVRCWDGTAVDRPRLCTVPSGPAGLEWVFPSFRRAECRDALVNRPDILRPEMWECSAFIQGREVLVRYSSLGNVAAGYNYYSRQYAAGDRSESDGRYVWRLPTLNDRGVYKLSSMYMDYPFSISVEASSVADRERAFSAVLEFRPTSQIRVRP